MKIMAFENISGRDALLASVSGLLMTASFPKIGWGPLAWGALVPLLWALKQGPASKGFQIGFLAGIIHYTTLLYWITNVMMHYGGIPMVVSWAILFTFASYLSLYLGLFCWGIMVARKRNARFVWFSPCLWVALEYVRAFFLTGFPWENLGYSQYDWLHVIQISDITGIYGVSAVIIAVNILIFQGLDAVHHKNKIPWISCLCVALFLGIILCYGALKIRATDREAATAPTYPVAVVQGNIDQSRKWLTSFQEETLKRYGRLTRSVVNDRPALIIWPETALPFYFLRHDVLTAQVMDLVRESKSFFLLGSPSVETVGKQVHYFNSAYLVDQDANILGRYDKVHLVPYGEYVPLRRFFPFIGKIVEAVGDFKAGREGLTLEWDGKKLGVLICFEVIFPELARMMAQNGAKLLVNITNDAWFGRSSAPYQHLSMAVFRAVENRRCLARSANTGISAFIDPSGRVIAETPLYEEAVRTQALPLMAQKTFYTRHGDIFAMASTVVSVAFFAFLFLAGRNKRSAVEI